MPVERFSWSEVDSFLDRVDERERLDQWWVSSEHQPINLYGRRRTGKSWLFRRVAHDKPAVILVARKSAPGAQLSEFADQLEPVLGVRPDIPDVPSLFRILLRAGRMQKFLAVVDEFPYLLPRGKAPVDRVLSGIAAVFEEELAASRLKLIVCGSTVETMASLQREKNPLHDRFTPLIIRPLPFDKARLFLKSLAPIEALERFAVAGGMPRYLSLLGTGPLRETVSRQILDHNAPLFDEVRAALAQELLQSGQYFSILQQLAKGDKSIADIAAPLKQRSGELTSYLETLAELGLVERRLPLGADDTSRQGHWHLTDPFFAFWFRFVFLFQDGLESGLRDEDVFDGEVAPALSEHVSRVFEEWSRSWARENYGRTATIVESWWGNALNKYRKSGERTTEEIDIVGTARSKVNLLGEAKWTSKPMQAKVLDWLERYKLPALKQAGFSVVDQPTILLLSKSGYSSALMEKAESDPKLVLVDVAAELA
jgi:hypothetical protein